MDPTKGAGQPSGPTPLAARDPAENTADAQPITGHAVPASSFALSKPGLMTVSVGIPAAYPQALPAIARAPVNAPSGVSLPQNWPVPASAPASNRSFAEDSIALSSALHEIQRAYMESHELLSDHYISESDVRDLLDGLHDQLRVAQQISKEMRPAYALAEIYQIRDLDMQLNDMEGQIKAFTLLINAYLDRLIDAVQSLDGLRPPSPNTLLAEPIRQYLNPIFQVSMQYMRFAERLCLLGLTDLAADYATRAAILLAGTRLYTPIGKFTPERQIRETLENAVTRLEARIRDASKKRNPPLFLPMRRFDTLANDAYPLPKPAAARIIRGYISQEDFDSSLPPLYSAPDFKVPYSDIPRPADMAALAGHRLEPGQRVALMARLVSVLFDASDTGGVRTSEPFTAPFGLFNTNERHAYVETPSFSWSLWIQHDSPLELNVLAADKRDDGFEDVFENEEKLTEVRQEFAQLLQRAANNAAAAEVLPPIIHLTYGRAYCRFEWDSAAETYRLRQPDSGNRRFLDEAFYPVLARPIGLPRLSPRQAGEAPPFAIITEHPLFRVEQLSREIKERLEAAEVSNKASNEEKLQDTLDSVLNRLTEIESHLNLMNGQTKRRFDEDFERALEAAGGLEGSVIAAKNLLKKNSVARERRKDVIRELFEGQKALADRIGKLDGAEAFYDRAIRRQLAYLHSEGPNPSAEMAALRFIGTNLECREYLRFWEQYSAGGGIPFAEAVREAREHLERIQQKLDLAMRQLMLAIPAHQGTARSALEQELRESSRLWTQVESEITQCRKAVHSPQVTHVAVWLHQRTRHAMSLFIQLRQRSFTLRDIGADASKTDDSDRAALTQLMPTSPQPLKHVAHVPAKIGHGYSGASHGGMRIGGGGSSGTGTGLPWIGPAGQPGAQDPNDADADDPFDIQDRMGGDRIVQSKSNRIVMPGIRFEEAGNLARAARADPRQAASASGLGERTDASTPRRFHSGSPGRTMGRTTRLRPSMRGHAHFWRPIGR